jgi:hypothetical protein
MLHVYGGNCMSAAIPDNHQACGTGFEDTMDRDVPTHRNQQYQHQLRRVLHLAMLHGHF